MGEEERDMGGGGEIPYTCKTVSWEKQTKNKQTKKQVLYFSVILEPLKSFSHSFSGFQEITSVSYQKHTFLPTKISHIYIVIMFLAKNSDFIHFCKHLIYIYIIGITLLQLKTYFKFLHGKNNYLIDSKICRNSEVFSSDMIFKKELAELLQNSFIFILAFIIYV